MQNKNQNPFGKIIHSYTRAQAIADGVLFDLTRLDAIQINWKCPVACTASVFDVINEAVLHGQDLDGLMHQISDQIMNAAMKDIGNPIVYFDVQVRGQPCRLKAHYGPGDTPEDVITIMLPEES